MKQKATQLSEAFIERKMVLLSSRGREIRTPKSPEYAPKKIHVG